MNDQISGRKKCFHLHVVKTVSRTHCKGLQVSGATIVCVVFFRPIAGYGMVVLSTKAEIVLVGESEHSIKKERTKTIFQASENKY